MTSQLPNWFRSAKVITPKDEQFALYNDAIEEITDSNKLTSDIILALARIAYQILEPSSQNFINVESICQKHVASHALGQKKLIGVIAGSAFMKIFNDDDMDIYWKQLSAVALMCLGFRNTRKNLIFPELIEAARATLDITSKQERSHKSPTDITKLLDTPNSKLKPSAKATAATDQTDPLEIIKILEVRIKEAVAAVVDTHKSLQQSLKALLHNQGILEEENLLLTWMFEGNIRCLNLCRGHNSLAPSRTTKIKWQLLPEAAIDQDTRNQDHNSILPQTRQTKPKLHRSFHRHTR